MKPTVVLKTEKLLARTAVFLLGIFIMALGVALSKEAGLGTSPISTVPAVLSDLLPLSFGAMTLLVNLIFIVLQYVVLRHDFRPEQLLQLPGLLLFSLFIDLWMLLFSGPAPNSYASEWVYCILSAVAVGFGVFLTVKSNLLMMPGDALEAAVSLRSKQPFARVKIVLDASMVIAAAAISLLAFGTLLDVREGTVFAALAVGLFVKGFDRLIGGPLSRRLTGEDEMVAGI